jgi:hexosaminidase
MRFKYITHFFVFICFFYNCKQAETSGFSTQIIPAPTKQTIKKGQFVLNNTTGISFNEEFRVSAEFLKSLIEDGSPINLQQNNTISFIKDPKIDNPEGYRLIVTPVNIEIRANTDQGAFYAVQSLRQLLPPEFENGSYAKDSVSITSISIKDEPRFKYRGMHLDVGRHMFPVAFIKKYIDAIAMLKMNTFHWHLTEDQGWRIEIKKYPKLQEIAAYRNETLIGHAGDQPQRYDGKRYGGYYTQDQIKDIVAYAQHRFVTIIPEIEMPGHSQAAIAAYPQLGCKSEPVEVATEWGVFEHIYCTKDETFDFLEDVLDEVMELFPGKYIHIGGDEAPKSQWKSCKVCQQRIKDEGLKDEHELQSYFISRIEKYLNSKGRQIIGWDEILEGGLAPNATVMSWRGIDGAIEAAKQHHNVILTPGEYCYFDHYQSEDKDNEPLSIGGFLPLEKVYGFNPIPDELSTKKSKYVLGAQGNVWTEYMLNSKHVEYMVFPRILAMSEVDWSTLKNKDYPNFEKRVKYFFKRLDALDINYAKHINNEHKENTKE